MSWALWVKQLQVWDDVTQRDPVRIPVPGLTSQWQAAGWQSNSQLKMKFID